LQDEQLAKEQEELARSKAMEEEREQIEKDKLSKQQQQLQQQQEQPLEGDYSVLHYNFTKMTSSHRNW